MRYEVYGSVAGLLPFAKIKILDSASSILSVKENAIFYTNSSVADAPVTSEQYAVCICVAQREDRRLYLYASTNYQKGAWIRVIFQNDDSNWMKITT